MLKRLHPNWRATLSWHTVGNMRDPNSNWVSHIKLALPLIRGHQRRRAAAFVLAPGVARLGTHPSRAHQSMNAIDAALFTEPGRIVTDLAIAVHAATFQPRCFGGGPSKRLYAVARLLSGFRRRVQKPLGCTSSTLQSRGTGNWSCKSTTQGYLTQTSWQSTPHFYLQNLSVRVPCFLQLKLSGSRCY